MRDAARGDGAGSVGAVRWAGIVEAREAAASMGASSVGTEHVLLALLAGPEDDATRALRGAGVDVHAICVALNAVVGGVGTHGRGEPAALPIADRVHALLRTAAERVDPPVRSTEHHAVRTIDDRDVLAALLASDDESVAALVMSYIGARSRTLNSLDRLEAAS